MYMYLIMLLASLVQKGAFLSQNAPEMISDCQNFQNLSGKNPPGPHYIAVCLWCMLTSLPPQPHFLYAALLCFFTQPLASPVVKLMYTWVQEVKKDANNKMMMELNLVYNCTRLSSSTMTCTRTPLLSQKFLYLYIHVFVSIFRFQCVQSG